MEAQTTERPAPPAAAAERPLQTFESLPGPRRVPVFGNLLQVDSTRLHQQLEQWSAEFGPVFRLKLGNRRVIVITDHELIATALRDRPDGFRRTTRLEEISTEMGLVGGVFGANGDSWRRQRRMVMASFDPGHIRHYYPSMQRVAGRLATRWEAAARDDAPIDLLADLMRYTVDTIAGLAFGAEVNTLESDEDVIQRHLNRIFPALFRRIFAPLPTWRWFASADDRALRASVAEVNVAVDDFIAQARARLAADPVRRANPQNLLEAMIVAADEPDSGIGDKEIAGNVLVMLLAGEDTTANTLAWMIHLLWKNPAALARATEEVKALCPDGAMPGLDELARMDYVEACAYEAMRLKPVAPVNVVQALRDTVLGDIRVPKHTLVMSAMRHAGVDARHVPQADAFVPERWLGDGGPAKTAQSPKRLSMPFGAGPRICPGRYLALLEIKLAIAALLGRFEIRSVGTDDGSEPRELLHLAMAPVGLTMRLARSRRPAAAAA